MSSITSPKPKLLHHDQPAEAAPGAKSSRILAPAPSGRWFREPGDTPFNTPADQPPPRSLRPAGGVIPSSPAAARVAPLNAASAMRGRGIGIGIAPTPSVAHAATPGNTPSSMERISHRIATSLLLGEQPQGQDRTGNGNRIAPSYERKFRADLKNLDDKLQEPSDPQGRRYHLDQGSPLASRKGEATPAEWPTAYSQVLGGSLAGRGIPPLKEEDENAKE